MWAAEPGEEFLWLGCKKPAGCPAEQPQSISVLVSFPKSNGAWQGNNTAMIELCGVNVKHSYKV